MATLGQYIIIKWNGTAIAGTRSNEFQNECDLIEKSSPTQGSAKEYESGRTSWSVTTGFLVGAVSNITSLLSVGSTVTLSFCNNTNGTVYLTGSAIVKRCKITAVQGNLVQGSFEFRGSGALV